MTNKIIFLSLFAIAYCTRIYSQEDSTKWILPQIVYGDINNDGIEDSLKIESSSYPFRRYRWTIFENDQQGKVKISHRVVPSLKLFSKDMEAFNIFKGGISITIMQYYDGYEEDNQFDETIYYYKFYSSLNGWYYTGEKNVYNPDNPNGKTLLYIGDLKSTFEISNGLLDAEIKDHVSIYSTNDSIAYSKKFELAYSQYLQEYKEGKNEFILKYGLIESIEYFQYIPLTTKNVVKFNDIAFFLYKAQKYREAIDILDILLRSYPKRIVAYINLGDSYWEVEEKAFAKQAYQKYIELMKVNGKENKIPGRIWNRIKE